MWCCAGCLVDCCLLAQSKHVGSQLEMCSGVSVCVRAWRQPRGEESLTNRCNQRAACLVITRACVGAVASPSRMQAPSTAASCGSTSHSAAPGACLGPKVFPRLACMHCKPAAGCRAAQAVAMPVAPFQLFTALFFLAGMPVPRPFPLTSVVMSCQRVGPATHMP